jgi:hypothetical protein
MLRLIMLTNYTSDHCQLLEKRPWDITEYTDSILIKLTDIPDTTEGGWHQRVFKPQTKVAKDSGGFAFLRDPELAENFSVQELIEKHRRVGITDTDDIISADFPIPRYTNIPQAEVERRHQISVDWHQEMTSEIPTAMPVLHGRMAADIVHHYEMYGLSDGEPVALGSNLSQGTSRVMSRIGANAKPQPSEGRKVGRYELWTTITDMMSTIRHNPVFLLGAGGMNAAPIAALLGARAVDATSWSLNAMSRAIFCTDQGQFIRFGTVRPNADQTWAEDFLATRLKDESYPLCTDRTGLNLKDLKHLFTSDGSKACELRMIHNISELDRDTEMISEYAGDPDGLADLLRKRYNTGWKDTMNLKILDMALASIRGDATVQTSLTNYSQASGNWLAGRVVGHKPI